MKQNIIRNLSFIFLIFLSKNSTSQNASLDIGEVGSENYYQEIKFEFINNKIIIPAVIDGITYRFMFDTGAPNMISERISNLIKAKPLNTISVTDGNGTKKDLDIVSVKQLNIGAVSFNNTATLVYNLDSNPLGKCFAIDGIIGSNMLRNSIVQIDLSKKTITLTNDTKKLVLNDSDASEMKLYGTQHKPFIFVNIGDKIDGEYAQKEHALLDMGASELYDLPRKHYDKFKKNNLFNLLGKSRGASSVSAFNNATIKEHVRLLIPKLTINGFEINNVVTNTTNDGMPKVGAKLLKYGIMTIDFKNEKFYFSPSYKKTDVAEPIIGLSPTLKNKKLVIGFVWDETLKKRVSYGDEILQVNGKIINESAICELATEESYFLKGASQLKLKVKNKKGKIFDLLVNKSLPETILTRKQKN